MEFVNPTPFPADLSLGEKTEPDTTRLGQIVAKATYRVADDGSVTIDNQEPMPVLAKDEEAELGLLPRDDMVRVNHAFEVILLGAAYAPRRRPVEELLVSMSLGDVKRELAVIGDRYWLAGVHSTTPTKPVPFDRMPLTWDRAFGGTAEVEIDVDSFVDVCDVRNREGTGFDVAKYAKELGDHLNVPSGFPKFDAKRRLPNLESPLERIKHPDDTPGPVCWATMSLQSGLRARRIDEELAPFPVTTENMILSQELMCRAHPAWIIDLPPPRSRFRLTHASPDGAFEFELPAVRVLADYVSGDKSATLELMPQVLIVHSEERMFTVAYRKRFNFPRRPGVERCIRLRIVEGWFTPPKN